MHSKECLSSRPCAWGRDARSQTRFPFPSPLLEMPPHALTGNEVLWTGHGVLPNAKKIKIQHVYYIWYIIHTLYVAYYGINSFSQVLSHAWCLVIDLFHSLQSIFRSCLFVPDLICSIPNEAARVWSQSRGTLANKTPTPTDSFLWQLQLPTNQTVPEVPAPIWPSLCRSRSLKSSLDFTNIPVIRHNRQSFPWCFLTGWLSKGFRFHDFHEFVDVCIRFFHSFLNHGQATWHQDLAAKLVAGAAPKLLPPLKGPPGFASDGKTLIEDKQTNQLTHQQTNMQTDNKLTVTENFGRMPVNISENLLIEIFETRHQATHQLKDSRLKQAGAVPEPHLAFFCRLERCLRCFRHITKPMAQKLRK